MPKKKKKKSPTMVAAGKRAVAKGKGTERQVAVWLHELGYTDARRTVQRKAAGVVGDVETEMLPNVHIEVKRFPKLGDVALTSHVIAACSQARRDCPQGKRWCVIWRMDGKKEWRLTVVADKRRTYRTDGECKQALEALNDNFMLPKSRVDKLEEINTGIRKRKR